MMNIFCEQKQIKSKIFYYDLVSNIFFFFFDFLPVAKMSDIGQFKTCKIRISRNSDNVQFNSNTTRLTRYMSTVKQWNQSQFDLSVKSVTFQSTFIPNARSIVMLEILIQFVYSTTVQCTTLYKRDFYTRKINFISRVYGIYACSTVISICVYFFPLFISNAK